MDPANVRESDIPFEPLTDRFEPIGKGPIGSRRIQRMVDHKQEKFVAVRRVGRDANLHRIRPLFSINHDAILPLREVCRDAEGIYLVGEWGDSTLADRLGQGPFSETDLHSIAGRVADGLRYLHQRGVAPVGPAPSHLVETPDGSVRIAALALPASSREAEAEGDAVIDDLRTLGRTLLALATGQENPSEERVRETPASIRSILRRCLAAGSTEGFHSVGELIRALASPTAPSADATQTVASRLNAETAAPPADSFTAPDGSASDEDGAVTTVPPRPIADARDLSPIPRPRIAPDEFTADGEQHPNAFPWRPVGELYKLVGDAREGGMGSVRMAVEKATGRKVAIKRILVDAGTRRSSLERFYREAHSIANLSHPHILALLQPARDEEGDYLVLEWAAGGSLKDLLEKQGKVALPQVLDVARKIGSALAYAHGKGVIHRDIKPHNILLTETGEPKLADFGLARSMADLTLSSSRGGAGSPLYMAPEQHTSSREADARSDLYSFGKTLYQLATGKPPVNPDPKLLPIEVRGAIMRCLEEDPGLRHANAKEFLADLDRRPSNAKPALWLTAAAALVAVVAFASGKLPLPFRPTTDPKIHSQLTGDPDGDPHGPADPNADPDHPGDQGQTTRGPVTPRPLPTILGLFAPTGALVANQTVLDKLQLKIDLKGATDIDPTKVRVLHNDKLLVDPKIEGPEAGQIVIEVPLARDQNRFEVDIEGYAPVRSMTPILRVFPEPTVTEVEGPVNLGGAYVTQENGAIVKGEVANGGDIRTLWLGDDSNKRPVEVKDSRFKTQLQLDEEGRHDLRWYWPDENTPLGGSGLSIIVDRTDPVLEVYDLVDGATVSEDSLEIHGSLSDDHLPDGALVEANLLDANHASVGGTRKMGLQGGTFTSSLKIPQSVPDGDLELTLSGKDAVGRGATRSITLHLDRTPPALADQPTFRPIRSGSAVTGVAIAGRATKPLKSALINQATATINGDQFRVENLPRRDGEDAYEVILIDLAGHESRPVKLGHHLDFTAPTLTIAFSQDASGNAIAKVTANKPLQSVLVNGQVANRSGDAFQVTLAAKLADLRDPKWGPTHDPIRVSATDAGGNIAESQVVVCPMGDLVAVPLGGKNAAGQYCSHANEQNEHRQGGRRAGVPQDYWLLAGTQRCQICGKPPAN